jgi:phage terminase small subunit
MPQRPAAPAAAPAAPAPRAKRGKNATPEGRAARVAALRARSPDTSAAGAVALANPERPLTAKQKAFVTEWARGETVLSAAVRAGYNDAGSLAYKMARDPAILKLYHAEKALYEAAAQMTRQKVMDGLLEGVALAKLVSEPASVIAGWREIGKMCGYYEPVKRQIDINLSADVTVRRLEALSDTELLKLVKGEVEDVVFEAAE